MLGVVPPPLEVAVAVVAMLVVGLQVEMQLPAWQVCPEVQACPQVPQWLVSVPVLPQRVPHLGCPDGHTNVQIPV